MKKRSFACSMAVIVLLSGSLCAGFAVSAEPLPSDWQPPEWVPTDFNEALKFENQYGNTHCADGMICFVRRENICTEATDEAYTYTTEISGSILDWACWNIIDHTYEFEMPTPPESDDKEEWNAFYQLCEEIGLPERMAESSYSIDLGYGYHVTLYDTVPETTMDITWNTFWRDDEEPIRTQTFSFETDADGNITQTDLFGWLPDSITEFEAFTAANDPVSIHGEYLVYADDVSYDGGYDVTVRQQGVAELEELLDYDINRVEIVYSIGGQGHNVRVYKMLMPGKIKITFTQEQQWEGGNCLESDDHYYEVGEDGTFTEIDPFDPEPLSGDCNGDGIISIADAVALRRYLTTEGTLVQPESADLDGDGRINAADLSLLKQYLITADTGYDFPIPTPDEEPALTLTTPYSWKAIDAAGATEFTVEAADGSTEGLEHIHVRLYDADTGRELAEFVQTDSGTWSCTAELTVTEACTMRFFAELSAENGDSAGFSVLLRSNVVTVSFSEVPPPA